MSLAESLAQAVGIGQINERARLVLGDCLDPVAGLASLPDQSVDHVITDPPYSEHTHGSQRVNRGGRAVSRDLGFSALSSDVLGGVAANVARVARRWVLIFCDDRHVSAWGDALESNGLEWLRVCQWHKINSMPQVTGDRPSQGHEPIVLAHRPGRKRWSGGGKPAIWRFPIESVNRCHPTQKPLALMRALVEDFTDPGDLILDPFAGSGTTGVAALTLGRRFIGWEMDAKHHATAARRIGETREQPSLLGPRGPKAKQQGLGL